MNHADYMTTHEAAAALGTTEKTLRWWRCKGKGPTFVKMGSSVLYSRATVAELAEEKERGAPAVTRTRP